MSKHKASNRRKIWKRLLASVTTLATVCCITPAFADGGWGNAPTNPIHGSGTPAVRWAYTDNDGGSLGRMDLGTAIKAIRNIGINYRGGDNVLQAAVSRSLSDCENRFNAKHPDQAGHASCRMVGVGVVIESRSNGYYGMGYIQRMAWINEWNRLIRPQTYSHNGVPYHVDDVFKDAPDRSVGSMVSEATTLPRVNAIVLSLNQYEPKGDPAPKTYNATVTTVASAPKDTRVGSTEPVHDMISVSGGNGESLDATVIMHFDGNNYVSSKQATKQVSVPSDGSTVSPDFTPSDFGMSHWQEGNYWFDVQIPKQGLMKDSINTSDHDPLESWNIQYEAPRKVSKHVQKLVSADSMKNRTTISTDTGRGTYEMVIKDKINPNGMSYTVDNYKLTDTTTNSDVSNQFQINLDKASNTVTATRSSAQGEMPLNHNIEFSFDVTVHQPENSKINDHATVKPNHLPEISTDPREFKTWKPLPDKSWVKWDDTKKTWDSVIDPGKTNNTGADNMTILDGDKIGSVVNGVVASNLIEAPKTLTLVDDYKNAYYIFDADTKKIHVYEQNATSDTVSSVQNIVNTGTDVTKHFKINVDGTRITATADKEYLAKLQGMSTPLQVSLMVGGKANYAHGKGAEQVRKDYGKQAGDEVASCATPKNSSFTNSGSQTVNNQSVKTNEPKICLYVPPVKKDVVSESSQGGAQETADGKVVFPGQKVEYRLQTQPKLPSNFAYPIKSVKVVDTYNKYLNIDKQTLEVTDLTNAKAISKKHYTTQWDDTAHTVTLNFDPKYVEENWKNGSNPRILIRFEGTVDKNAPTSTKVHNKWMLLLNNSITPSNEVGNNPPSFTPHKTVNQSAKQGDGSVLINGKTFLTGDTGAYHLTLDLTQHDMAYKVHRAGIVDDYDKRYLKVDAKDIHVKGADGKDYTSKFNISVINGVVYVFAKTVDTFIYATGVTVKGDPQPKDLAQYANSKDYKPLENPSIDQKLLGQKYTVEMPFTVTDGDGVKVVNTATQVVNNISKKTNTVTNEIKKIKPKKDVTIKVGSESANGSSVYLKNTFLYQLDTAILPKNRAYQKIKNWQIVDKLDPAYDRVTGAWAVYATRDLYKGNTVFATKGTQIAGLGADAKYGNLFTYSFKDNTVTISATEEYLKLVSADNEHESGWRAYVQVERMKVTKRHENKFTEIINNSKHESNLVWTRTPDLTPSLHIIKWDKKSGKIKGDRNDPKDALPNAKDGDVIVFTITNTSKTDTNGYGAWFKATDLQLEDKTIVGTGVVTDLKYPENWKTLVLKPNQSVDVEGVLHKFKAGTKHTNRAVVRGIPLLTCRVTNNNGLSTGSKTTVTKPIDGKTDGKKTDVSTTAPTGKDGKAVEYTVKPTDGKTSKETDTTTAESKQQKVTVDGVTLCTDTQVTSNTDDWNGTAPLPQLPPEPPTPTIRQLAKTGVENANVLLTIVMASALIGACLVMRKTQESHARHGR